MTSPWLSVLLPTYNGEAYLASTLDSILLQGDDDIECIAVDDGSSDGTLPILDSYRDRLHIRIEHRKKGNWVSNTNYALSLAAGEYVCFLHQDDLWLKDRLNAIRALIEQFPAADFFLHPSLFLDENGDRVGVWNCPLAPHPKIIEAGGMMEKLLVQNFISIPAPVFRRELALAVGGLDEALWYTADWDLWLKISSASRTIYHPKPLSAFRIHSHSQTFTRSARLGEFKEQHEIVFRRHFESWDAPAPTRKKVARIAEFSINVNTALAGAMHHRRLADWFRLASDFLALGPAGWRNYLENSRIWERASARLKILPAARSAEKKTPAIHSARPKGKGLR
jgi:GT2 family glycosyltransferase